jgi:glyoxylase-like metal-dependent hydrolase (beta-lactamase superfamily II)
MLSFVKPTSDFYRITSDIAIWHSYDASVKAELYSICLTTFEGMYLIDPIPIEREALDELIRSHSVAGIIVTNANHHRACSWFAEQFSAPIFARCEAFSDKAPSRFRKVDDDDEICDGLRAIRIEGAADGEIVLHCAADGGTLIVGDALINFEPYGFMFLPRKYCLNEKQMRRSLQKLLDYKAERMLFAHGPPILSGATERLRGLLNSSNNFTANRHE